MNILIIMIAIMVVSVIVQQMLQSRFNKYSQVGLPNGMSGAEVAQKMLRDHGIYDVKVVPTRGMLTDHFNPATTLAPVAARPRILLLITSSPAWSSAR